MKKIGLVLVLIFFMVSCKSVVSQEVFVNNDKILKKDFNFIIDPETFDLKVELNGVIENVSEPIEKREVINFKNDGKNASWTYEKDGINVEIEKKNGYLDVSISSIKEGENNFLWPLISGEEYVLPIGQGKLIPKDDENWKKYFNQISEIKTIEGLSMQFFGVNKKEYSLVYIIDNVYNNALIFDTEDDINFSFNHEFPSINKYKKYGFKIYVTDKDITNISKVYRNYLIENDKFKTLKDKERDNDNIKKLYGAPHIYFWNSRVISEDNINWKKIKNNFPNDLKIWIQKLLREEVEDGEELLNVFDEIEKEEFVSKYLKNKVIKTLSEVVKLREFYNDDVFKNLDKDIEKYTNNIENLNELEVIDFNKKLLKLKLGDIVDSIDKWADSATVDVLNDFKSSGLSNLWIGFDSWENGFIKPEFVDMANNLGYLIGTYDSYHSIHKSGEEKWITAKFEDESLYENATVTNKNGEKIEGFNGVGRKLNPTLAMPSVKSRVNSILDTGLKFNSWFLDTDGTGEVYDDYSKNHVTTEKEDIAARIERVNYLSNEKNMVIGTEGGNDFINQYVAFAHGIELPAFSWLDKDMSKNKESEYYVGNYYAPGGGVAKMFSQQVPLKKYLRDIFLNSKYNIPLYKLVYNDSTITTYWWGWGTLKFVDDIQERMLSEILYNIPPLYHIDDEEWKKHKDVIVNHSKVWSEFSKKVINREMTKFERIDEDGYIQMTQYGDDIKVIANFSEKDYKYGDKLINAKSLLIIDGKNQFEYIPKA